MSERLERDVRFLKRYAVISTLAFGVLALAAFRQGQTAQQAQKVKFTEIDVERINVVEPDGSYRLVIANRPRSIGPIYKGKPFGYEGGGRPGMIFFNDEGTENGGLTFTGRRLPNGTFSSSLGMSFDQFDQDQVMTLRYDDNNGQRRLGLTFADRADVNIYDWVMRRDSITKHVPAGAARDSAMKALVADPRPGEPLYAPRVYVGRDRAKSSLVTLSDRQGKARLRLAVDSLGAARIEFLDAEGKVTHSLPESKPD
jgi:hypothetical protein